jgi:hypothetical protein
MAVADEPEICSEKFEEAEKGSQSKWIFECGGLPTAFFDGFRALVIALSIFLKPLLVQ